MRLRTLMLFSLALFATSLSLSSHVSAAGMTEPWSTIRAENIVNGTNTLRNTPPDEACFMGYTYTRTPLGATSGGQWKDFQRGALGCESDLPTLQLTQAGTQLLMQEFGDQADSSKGTVCVNDSIYTATGEHVTDGCESELSESQLASIASTNGDILGGETSDDGSSEGGVRECNAGPLGWAICPGTGALAKGVDGVYGILVNFVRIPPMESGMTTSDGKTNAVYIIWQTFRNLANIVFVVLLLFALMSQISNIGISNYGLKRILPRIIVSAVLVNISFFIAQIAVDISNILGQSIYNFLDGLSESVSVNVSGVHTWSTVATAVLSLGAVGGVGSMWVSGLAMGLGPAMGYVFIPIVLAALVAAFTAFTILGLRYILIYLLVAISPLAFVAYLLPNTAKYFEKWKDIFFVILLFYPLFSLLFGMSQIVGLIAMSGAEQLSDEFMGVVMYIFGLFIQIAPLFLSYKLLQTANSLAGTLTNGLQRSGSGVISRAKARRNKELGDATKAGLNRSIARSMGPNAGSKLRPRNAVGRVALASRMRRQATDDIRQTYGKQAESAQLDSLLHPTGKTSQRFLDANRELRAASSGLSRDTSDQQSQFVAALAQDEHLQELAGGGALASATDKGKRKDILESVSRQAQAVQSAEEKKEYTAMFSGQSIVDLKSALEKAVSNNESSKAQAIQSLMYGQGEGAIKDVASVIKSAEAAGVRADSSVMLGMKENIRANHGNIKDSDLSQVIWASGGSKSLENITKEPTLGNALSAKSFASQTDESLFNMAQSGMLTQAMAQEIKSNQNITQGMKPTQMEIVNRVSQGQSLPADVDKLKDEIKAAQAAAKGGDTTVNNVNTTNVNTQNPNTNNSNTQSSNVNTTNNVSTANTQNTSYDNTQAKYQSIPNHPQVNPGQANNNKNPGP